MTITTDRTFTTGRCNGCKTDGKQVTKEGMWNFCETCLPGKIAAATPTTGAAAAPTSGPIAATPAKLKSGEWGARIARAGGIKQGDVVTLKVTTRAGKTWTAEHTIIWVGDGAALAAKNSSAPTEGRHLAAAKRNPRMTRDEMFRAMERDRAEAARRRCGCTGCRTHGTCLVG